jgi:hypothetical protein
MLASPTLLSYCNVVMISQARVNWIKASQLTPCWFWTQVPECARLAQEAVDEGMCVVIGLQVNPARSAAKCEWHPVLDLLPLQAVTTCVMC